MAGRGDGRLLVHVAVVATNVSSELETEGGAVAGAAEAGEGD